MTEQPAPYRPNPRLKRVEAGFEGLIFNSRWLMAPFYFGLVVSLAVLMLKFCMLLWEFIVHAPGSKESDIILGVLSLIDVFMEDGYTKEEWKMMMETKKILDPKIKLTATCVRVPVFVGHSEAVSIEFENPISPDEARDILRNAPGCLVIDKHEPGGYVTPYEAAGEDATYISRIREDATVENGLSMWVVSDNLRKGAALNAIQIAECLINRKLITAKRKAA